MARKKRTKTKTKTKESRASKTALGYGIDRLFDENLFWSKITNGFKKFLESPFNQ